MLRNLALAALAAVFVVPSLRADPDDRLFDFTDEYYLANGVNPAQIGGRRQADGVRAVIDVPFFAKNRNVRALVTLPAYNASGSAQFFTVMGGGSVSLFTNDAAGRKARQTAEAYIEYVFPSRGTDPVGLGAARQSVILDTRDGYFGNDPLGLWLHVWVSYTDAAFNTTNGRKELDDMARRNGLAADGTPLLKTVGDIDRLFGKGLLTKQSRPTTDGLRYAICPVIEDPTDGGIAPDAFLSYTKKADGTPLEIDLYNDFVSLQHTGRFPH